MRSSSSFIVVEGVVPTDPRNPDPDNLRDKVWAYAMDQRAFGPRKLLVALAEADGRLRGIAFTERRDPIDPAFEACLLYLGTGAAAAVAYLDEPVDSRPPPPAFYERYARLREVASVHGIALIDWISCDDEAFRAVRLQGHPPEAAWWDLDSA